MESIHCLLMLEDQLEERACRHALGLLDAAESRAFELEAAGNERLQRVAAELEEALANLSLSTTPIHLPRAEFRSRLLQRIAAEPARVTTDREGRIETINPAFTHLCGYRLEELRGRKPGHLLQGPATDPAAVQAFRSAVKAGSAVEVELINYHKDASPYRVHIQLDPIFNGANTLTGFRATERRLAS